MNEQFNWYKNQLVHKGIQHLHVSKQATKIREIRLHYLGYIIVIIIIIIFSTKVHHETYSNIRHKTSGVVRIS